MNIFSRLRKMIDNLLAVKPIMLATAFSLILPLTASAKNVEVWELDNFFAPPNCIPSCPDAPFTVKIEKGDTITFINMGATDHDAANGVVTLNGKTFFEGDIFVGNTQSPGEILTTKPFNTEGKIPFFCQIHGAADMSGTIIVGTGGGVITPTPTPTPGEDGGKSFNFKCEREFEAGIAGLDTLSLDLGEEMGCTLRLVKPKPGVNVLINHRKFFRGAVSVNPVSGETNKKGKIEFTIRADDRGIDWLAWAVPNEEGEIEFNKEAFADGNAWGMFVEVKYGLLAQRTQSRGVLQYAPAINYEHL